MIKAGILSISVSSRVTVAGLLVFGLAACSSVTTPIEPGGSVVLADLGPQGNAAAIKQNEAWKTELGRGGFTQPLPGTEGTIFMSGYRPFGGPSNADLAQGSARGLIAQSNVSGQSIQHIVKGFEGDVDSRSVDGATISRGVVEQNGKKYTVFAFEGDTNYATPALMTTAVQEIRPNAAVSMGQTTSGSRVEVGATGAANTRALGYDGVGNESEMFARNASRFFDENDAAKGTATPVTTRVESATALSQNLSLPLAANASDSGNYLCAAALMATEKARTGTGFQPLPGLEVPASDGIPEMKVNAFIHQDAKTDPATFGPEALRGTITSLEQVQTQQQTQPETQTEQPPVIAEQQPAQQPVEQTPAETPVSTPTETIPEIGLR